MRQDSTLIYTGGALSWHVSIILRGNKPLPFSEEHDTHIECIMALGPDMVVFIDYFTKVGVGVKWGRGCIEEGGGGGRKGVREEEGRQDCKVRGRRLFWRLRLQAAKVIECITFLPPPPGHPPAHSHQRLEWLDSGQCQVCTVSEDNLLFRDPISFSLIICCKVAREPAAGSQKFCLKSRQLSLNPYLGDSPFFALAFVTV